MVRPRLFKNIELCFPLSQGTCRCRKVPEFLNLLPGIVSVVIPAQSSSRMNSELSDKPTNRLVIWFQRTESEGLVSPFIRASLLIPRFKCCWWSWIVVISDINQVHSLVHGCCPTHCSWENGRRGLVIHFLKWYGYKVSGSSLNTECTS